MSIAPIGKIAITAMTSQRGSINSYISKLVDDGGRGHARKSMRADFILGNHPLLSVRTVPNSILRHITLNWQQTNNREMALACMVDTATGEKVYFLTHSKFIFQHFRILPILDCMYIAVL